MGQQEQCNDMAEPELPARHGLMAPWLRRIAACALALTIGLGQAYADQVTSGHEGGQGADKSGSFATGEAFAGDGTAHASSTAKSEGFGAPRTKAAAQPLVEEAKVTVKVEEEGIGTEAWTRTVTRTKWWRSGLAGICRTRAW